MEIGTLGDTKKYKALAYIIDKIDDVDKIERKNILSFFHKFSVKIKKAESIRDAGFRDFVLKLMLDHYFFHADKLGDEKMASYIKNYIAARIRTAYKNK
jgi:hypothetical protein